MGGETPEKKRNAFRETFIKEGKQFWHFRCTEKRKKECKC